MRPMQRRGLAEASRLRNGFRRRIWWFRCGRSRTPTRWPRCGRVALADAAIADALAKLRPGMMELDVAWMIESYFRTHGAEGPSFDTIVACGPNGARPHAHAGDRRCRPVSRL